VLTTRSPLRTSSDQREEIRKTFDGAAQNAYPLGLDPDRWKAPSSRMSRPPAFQALPRFSGVRFCRCGSVPPSGSERGAWSPTTGRATAENGT